MHRLDEAFLRGEINRLALENEVLRRRPDAATARLHAVSLYAHLLTGSPDPEVVRAGRDLLHLIRGR